MMRLLSSREQCQVNELVGEAITKLCEALAITVKAEGRVVNGSVDVTALYDLRDAIKSANKACKIS
jgi:transcription termination factor Rho